MEASFEAFQLKKFSYTISNSKVDNKLNTCTVWRFLFAIYILAMLLYARVLHGIRNVREKNTEFQNNSISCHLPNRKR